MSADLKIDWPCPVCGYDSFGEPPGSYVICLVCGWENDPIQILHPRMRGGANGGSIFDYQQESVSWNLPCDLPRDPDWRLLEPNEAALPNGENGIVDYTLDYYSGRQPYYWRNVIVVHAID